MCILLMPDAHLHTPEQLIWVLAVGVEGDRS